jgi:hypothetical protein
MSARPGLCGGRRATGVPTAIVNYPGQATSIILLPMETSWKQLFAPDCGMVFEIRVYGVDAEDFDILMPVLATRYSSVYSENGTPKDMPDYHTILQRQALASVFLALNIEGVEVRCWFCGRDEINFDLLPDDVDSEEKATAILALMRTISATVRKRVLLTAENSCATQQWSEEHAICAFDPPPR